MVARSSLRERTSGNPDFLGTRGTGQAVCLLATLHPERGLSLALIQHLTEELPNVEFTLVPRADVDLVWVCGYESGNAQLIAGLRARYPHASLLASSRESEETWAREVLDAGADDVLTWPVELARLARILRKRQRGSVSQRGST